MRGLTKILLLLVAACAPQYDDAPVKLVGVGYHPDEIGPSPTPYGGVVEYSLVNFAGGGLSLALMSLGSFDEVGPGFVSVNPPYRAVYGFSYMFDAQLSAADSLGGVTSVPPETEETCYTTFEASGPIGSFTTVDVGSYMEFKTADGNAGFRMDRLPADYPANTQDSFVYYSGLDSYQSSTYPANDADPIRPENFPLGQAMKFRFPGGMAPPYSPLSSLPQPSSAVGDTIVTLPQDLGPVMVNWTGPQYDSDGVEVGEAGDHASCVSYYLPGTEPTSPEECAEVTGGLNPASQIYTGPWDTDDGKVAFHWVPTANTNEIVSLSVRFLGKVDRDSSSFKVRDAHTPCEPGEWVFDTASYEDKDGNYRPVLNGDPMHNLSEVTCRLKDDGDYELSVDQLQEALTYARRYGAEGAVFYLARSTEADVTIPPVMNSYEQRLDVSPIKLTSRVIDIGRFWYKE
jgi:hypothetical protein